MGFEHLIRKLDASQQRNRLVGFGFAVSGNPFACSPEIEEQLVRICQEAVLNALWAAPDTTGRAGRIARGLPHDDTLELLEAHERLSR